MTEQDRVEKVADALAEHCHEPRGVLLMMARAAIAAMTPTPQEAAKVLIDALEGSWPHNWRNVWDAMREDAREMDMPAAFMEALRVISEDSH